MLMVMMLKVAYHVDPTAATGSCAVLVVGGERSFLSSSYSCFHKDYNGPFSFADITELIEFLLKFALWNWQVISSIFGSCRYVQN